jgi:phospholipase A1
MTNIAKILFTLLLLAAPYGLRAQEATDGRGPAPVIRSLRPVYYTTGAQLGAPLSGNTADMKFQISFRTDLAQNIGGSGISLAIGYTQVSLWSFYIRSYPFYDHTFIPGLYAWKEFDAKDGKHSLLWGYEHRSNGRDDAYSRSVNYLFCSWFRQWNLRDEESLTLSAAARFGVGCYGDVYTFDILTKYLGIARLRAAYRTCDGRWELAGEVLPLLNKSLANVTADASWCIAPKLGYPSLFVQYHYGYDEAFRDCVTVTGATINPDGYVPYDRTAPAPPRHMLRFGLLFSPGNVLR